MTTEANHSALDAALQSDLDAIRRDGLYRSLRTVASAQGTVVQIDGRNFLNFSSNDYLGLANDPRLKQSAQAAIEKYGVGSGSARLISGNLEPYDVLEQALRRFKRKAAAVVFSSGYVANVATISALVGEGDVVLIDKLCHASIIDGCRQSGATVRVYPHFHLARLEELLQQSGAYRRRLVITETIFSMDGDVAPLRDIVELKDRHGAWLMIDEAHGTGVFGVSGRGAAEHFGVEDRIDVTLGTLSKALGSMGGYVAGSQSLIEYLRHKARGLVYSTAMPPSTCAAAASAVEIVMSEDGRDRRWALWRNVRHLESLLGRASGANRPSSPILPHMIGDETVAMQVAGALFVQGVYVPAIRYPTVAKGKARLRVAVTAAHAPAQLQAFADCLGKTRASA